MIRSRKECEGAVAVAYPALGGSGIEIEDAFFGDLGVSQVTQDTAQEYRIYRLSGGRPGEEVPPIDGAARPRKPPTGPRSPS